VAAAGLVVAVTDLRYRAHHVGDVVRLEDDVSQSAVSVSPPDGNNAFEMRLNGWNVLWFPYDSLDDFRARGNGRAGIPFLGPWANRLDEQAFYANGRRYPFDMDIGNVRGTIPIHGLLMRTDRWRVVDVSADDRQAWVTSRLEFFREPLWMKQFPFAHAIEMTHRLRDGALEVTTRIENLSHDPMPAAIGFHPYFRFSDSGRDEWTVAIGARTRWRLSDAKLPTGETEAIEASLPNRCAVPLRDYELDHVFTDLIRDGDGNAVMSAWGREQRIDVEVGQNYRAMVIYAPRGTSRAVDASAPHDDFVCLEPMVGISNSMNLAHRGLYGDLQYIPPGGTWQESFRIRPSGF
jgi:aldose 1-epimerase